MAKDLVTIEQLPIIPPDWEYKQSVAKCRQLIYKWKSITVELATELWVAREMLSASGRRTDLGTIVPRLPTWEQYCKEIRASKQVVNRWLARFFDGHEEEKELPSGSDTGELYRLFHGDFRGLCQDIEPESVDVIITDPPYGEEYVSLYGDLAELGARVLKPGGSLLAMSGCMFLPDVLNQLGRHLRYHWAIAFQMGNGTSRIFPKRVCQVWKPVLWFVKGEYNGDWVTDLIKSASVEKGHGEWQQPVEPMKWLVERFTSLGGLVLDPMMGTGTTGVAATSLGRRFLGYEVNDEMIEIAKGRLNHVETAFQGE